MAEPLDISALVNSLRVQPRGNNEMLASNVVASLAARILQAQFGSELAFPGKSGKATLDYPDGTANADYNRGSGNIRVSPTANNNAQTMYMKKDKDLGYVGDFKGNPTTEDVLNMVETLRHEIYHARANTPGIINRPPTEAISNSPNRDNIIQSLQLRRLPSMKDTFPLEEFLATAIPMSTAEQKLGKLTSKQQTYKNEIAHMTDIFPELKTLIENMERPELLGKN